MCRGQREREGVCEGGVKRDREENVKIRESEDGKERKRG